MTTMRWRSMRGVVVGILVLTLLPLALEAQDRENETGRVQEILRSFLDESGAPGVSVAWGRSGGRVRTVAAGMTSEGGGRPVAPGDRFHAGSIGKTFTAATVLALVRDGSLDLDAPLSRWLGHEAWHQDLPNAGKLTLRHLLSHTSGIPDHVDDPDFGRAVAQGLGGPDPDPDIALSPRELVGFVLDDEPLFEPGQGYAYSDTNFILLGLVVEEVTGRNFYEVLRERFLEPLALEGTIPADRRAMDDLVTGYNRDGWLGLPEVMLQDGKLLVNPANEWTGGGLASTPSDLARWLLALAEGRTVLSHEGFELMREGAPSGADGRYGLGLALGRTRHGPVVGHDGIFPGYRARMAYYVDHGLAISAMANQNPAELGRLVDRIAGVVLGPGAGGDDATPPDDGWCLEQGLRGRWPLDIPIPNGNRIRGSLEVREGPGGGLVGSWTQAGLLEEGQIVWDLEGGIEEGRFELASVGPPRGAAASEMADVGGVVFEGEATEEAVQGEYFVVIQGRRYDKDFTFRVSREKCGG